jgi:hypothetical protein
MTDQTEDDEREQLWRVRLDELLALDQDARCELVREISSRGFEPGCWLRVHDTDLSHRAVDGRAVIDALGGLAELECDLTDLEEFEANTHGIPRPTARTLGS